MRSRPSSQAGAARVILGTAAFRDPEFLDAAVSAYPDQVVVSVDARGGRVAAAGWTEETDLQVVDALQELQARGVRRFVYSNIDRDGMLTGPDLDGAREVAAAIEEQLRLLGWRVASSMTWRRSQACERARLSGVIVGKAIYERRFDVGDAQALLDRLV